MPSARKSIKVLLKKQKIKSDEALVRAGEPEPLAGAFSTTFLPPAQQTEDAMGREKLQGTSSDRRGDFSSVIGASLPGRS